MGRHILVVEPFVALAAVLKDALEALGHTVSLKADDRIGPETFRDSSYDCILIDLANDGAPWTDKGLSFSTMASDLRIPLVMVPDRFVKPETIAAHHWVTLAKPFTLSELADAIDVATKAGSFIH